MIQAASRSGRPLGRHFRRYSVLAAGLLMLSSVQAEPALESYVDRVLDRYDWDGRPGVTVLVARDDRVLLRETRGMADLELNVVLAPDHHFRIGSITKQFAAAAILKLAEEGKLALDDPLAKYLPDYPNGGAISVRQLLNHTAGVPSYTEIPGYMDGPVEDRLSTEELIARFSDLPADFEPGAQFHYSNSGYVLIGAIIEKVSGQPWHDYLRDEVLAPLSLADIQYGDQAAIIPGRVSGYAPEGDGFVNAPYLSMTQPHAAGALVATAESLWQWQDALHHGRVFDQDDSYQAMITPRPAADGTADDYGLGLVVTELRGVDYIGHGGGIHGFASATAWFPDSNTSLVILANSTSDLPTPNYLQNYIGSAIIGKPFPLREPVQPSAEQIKDVTGVYSIGEGDERRIRWREGVMESQRSGGAWFEIHLADDGAWFYQRSPTYFELERDDAGAVTAMLMYQNGDGPPERAEKTADEIVEREAIELPTDYLQQLLGIYELQPGFSIEVLLQDGQLLAQATGQDALPMFAATRERFFLRAVDAELVFSDFEGGIPQTMTLHQAGREMVGQRLSQP